MFIKVKTKEGNDLLVNTAQIMWIAPQPGDDGCYILLDHQEDICTSTSFDEIERSLVDIGGLILYTNLDELLDRYKKGG